MLDENSARLCDTQSTIFYVELLPALYQLSIACGVDRAEIVDIGPATCAGVALLDSALNRLLGWPVAFTGIDISDYFRSYAQSRFPHIRHIVGDALHEKYQGQFDIVLCSHVLEHVSDPVGFVRRCNGIARKFCLFYAPYAEQNLIEGHVNSIDRPFIDALPGVFWSCVRRSPGWRPASDPNPHVVMFATASTGNTFDLRSIASALDREYQAAIPQ